MARSEVARRLAERLLGEAPDPVVRLRLPRDVLRRLAGDRELAGAVESGGGSGHKLMPV